MKQLLKQKKGMTLIELILSLTILAIVVLPFSGMFLNSVRIGSTSADYMKATQLAQRLMEEYKNKGFGLVEESRVNPEGTEDTLAAAYTTITEDGLEAKVYYYVFTSINKYDADSAGLPSSYDVTARLEEVKAGYTSANNVFYYYNDGTEKAFSPAAASNDIIDSDEASPEINVRQLKLENEGADVRLTITKSDGTEISESLPLKAEGMAYNFKIECLGAKEGSELQYQIINSSGRELNVYKLITPEVNAATGELVIRKNNVGITNLDGVVNIKNNTYGRDFINGKHYKIRVRVSEEADGTKALTELYGISR